MSLSFVIPAFNEQGRLPATLERLTKREGEIVVVDDGSLDVTAQAAQEFASSGVRVFRLTENRGKGAALRAGVAETRGDVVFFVDADLPYRLDFIDRALERLGQGADAAIGARDLPESSYDPSFPRLRVLSGKAFSYILRALLPIDIFDTQCGFKAFRGDLIRSAIRHARCDGYTIDVEILLILTLWGARIEKLPVHLERHHGSKIRLVRDSLKMFGEAWRIRRRWKGGEYPQAQAS